MPTASYDLYLRPYLYGGTMPRAGMTRFHRPGHLKLEAFFPGLGEPLISKPKSALHNRERSATTLPVISTYALGARIRQDLHHPSACMQAYASRRIAFALGGVGVVEAAGQGDFAQDAMFVASLTHCTPRSPPSASRPSPSRGGQDAGDTLGFLAFVPGVCTSVSCARHLWLGLEWKRPRRLRCLRLACSSANPIVDVDAAPVRVLAAQRCRVSPRTRKVSPSCIGRGPASGESCLEAASGSDDAAVFARCDRGGRADNLRSAHTQPPRFLIRYPRRRHRPSTRRRSAPQSSPHIAIAYPVTRTQSSASPLRAGSASSVLSHYLNPFIVAVAGGKRAQRPYSYSLRCRWKGEGWTRIWSGGGFGTRTGRKRRGRQFAHTCAAAPHIAQAPPDLSALASKAAFKSTNPNASSSTAKEKSILSPAERLQMAAAREAAVARYWEMKAARRAGGGAAGGERKEA
ncbi:hypothetical protein R3P38DRAFT_3345114 [Favolaschia claudopus]|uniref:Uncharacterized protein n=1 Tax=Favolaschia claudopus TaxID=2862362 RepID=A0AAW0DGN3_9AGAR